jgi:hypothetical protein
MKVIVTPVDIHPVEGHPLPHRDHGEPFTGRMVFCSREGVLLDGRWVIKRDRRRKSDQLPGHPWLTRGPLGWGINWTSFSIGVEP